jgi:hypothetical protein
MNLKSRMFSFFFNCCFATEVPLWQLMCLHKLQNYSIVCGACGLDSQISKHYRYHHLFSLMSTIQECLNIHINAPVALQLTDSETVHMVMCPNKGVDITEINEGTNEKEHISTDKCIS